MEEIKQRNYLFDNLKAFTLFCVAFGHILDVYIERPHSVFQIIMEYMYLFNMPMFAFVTGYFTKDVEKARNTAVKKVLMPYLLLQSLYILMALFMMEIGLASYNTDIFRASLLLPTSPLFYLLCVFIWKLFLKDICSLRYPLVFSVVIGVGISWTTSEQLHIGIGEAFSLLVFFLLGVFCTGEHIKKIRSMPKWIGYLILIMGIVPASHLPYEFRNLRYTYEQVGLTWISGALYRLLFYVIAACMMLALLNVMSDRRHFFTKIGKNSIIVYAASSFLSPHGYLLVAALVPAVVQNPISNLIGMIVFSGVLVYAAAMEWIKKLFDWVIYHVNRWLFK